MLNTASWFENDHVAATPFLNVSPSPGLKAGTCWSTPLHCSTCAPRTLRLPSWSRADCCCLQVLHAISEHVEPSFTPTLVEDVVAQADAWQLHNLKVFHWHLLLQTSC
jgi:hypothetical protein